MLTGCSDFFDLILDRRGIKWANPEAEIKRPPKVFKTGRIILIEREFVQLLSSVREVLVRKFMHFKKAMIK